MKLSLKIPPLALGVITLSLIWLVDRYVPILHVKFMYQNIVASVISGSGFFVALSGILAFRKLKTTVDPRYPEKVSKLVIIGIYKHSRNPMYLGMLLALIGFVIYLGSPSGTVIICLFVSFINKYQIVPEEKVLQEKFGEDFAHYTRSVRRWV
ncbi:methyltransferase family protein [Thermodesulfobacteriota bacterium]